MVCAMTAYLCQGSGVQSLPNDLDAAMEETGSARTEALNQIEARLKLVCPGVIAPEGDIGGIFEEANAQIELLKDNDPGVQKQSGEIINTILQIMNDTTPYIAKALNQPWPPN